MGRATGPKGSWHQRRHKLNREINAGLADPKIIAHFADLGYTPYASTPSDFGKLIVDDTEKWAKVIRAANIKPE
jgi:tripartite-type tricarboxylate transporter receptor subunit TctC